MGHYFISLFYDEGSKGLWLFIQLVWVNVGCNIFDLTIWYMILISVSKTSVVTDLLRKWQPSLLSRLTIYTWRFGLFPNNFILIGSKDEIAAA